MMLDPRERDRMLAAYLDDALAPEERRAFESAMESDPALRREVELARRIEDSLRRLYAPPPASAPTEREGGHSAARLVMPTRRRLLGYAAAAVLLVAASVTYRVYFVPSAPVLPPIHPASAFARLVNAGFTPEFVCTTDEEFERTVRERFGQGMLIQPTEGLTLLGWGYGSGYSGTPLTRDTLVLLTRVNESPVVVFMDRAKNDREIEQPKDPALHLHKRRLGRLVLYEVSASPAPQVIDKAYDPAVRPN